ncbi:MAG: hypothetical protein QJT81_06690 [Candidatus Thiothrix putei]|jgi:hypothetical protein|uniref:Uncharacterized protein n=2 Tax=Thiothrix TaxID=1030 RepID=A0A1H4D504_9GAMM|nr:hypothetical protein [Thiothrix caldifontis]WGZ95668.1 MAG: hypothetical protein QJT81_06690 [Candidatus Thiothrix putei]SEA67794.1 hypothetical protein SAMN05660964_02159 [Thiothrix caldifontis]
MNDLVARTYCAVPSEVLKALLFTGIAGVIFLSIARLMGVEIPSALIVGLIGFFFVGAILASHGLSILRKPGLVLLVGTVSIVAAVQLQDAILNII